MHTINGDPNVAKLQKYTIDLYKEIEELSGQPTGLHLTGGVTFASDPDRWEWLQSAWAVFQAIGIETSRLVTPDEIAAMNPLLDMTGIKGGLHDVAEGYLDPNGTTHAYAKAAQKRGADVILRNRVLAISRQFEKVKVEDLTDHFAQICDASAEARMGPQDGSGMGSGAPGERERGRGRRRICRCTGWERSTQRFALPPIPKAACSAAR